MNTAILSQSNQNVKIHSNEIWADVAQATDNISQQALQLRGRLRRGMPGTDNTGHEYNNRRGCGYEDGRYSTLIVEYRPKTVPVSIGHLVDSRQIGSSDNACLAAGLGFQDVGVLAVHAGL